MTIEIASGLLPLAMTEADEIASPLKERLAMTEKEKICLLLILVHVLLK
jgi:hypothetical protein